MHKKTSLHVAAILYLSSVLLAFPSVTKISDSVVDSQALTISGFFGQAINGLSFQQDIALTHLGYQYVGYYNGNRHVCVARRKLPAGTWEIMELTDYYFSSNDAHNTISLGICPNDGTIHLSFDHHGHTLHYRVSQAGVASNPASTNWSSSLFGPVRNYLEEGKSFGLTYPAFIQTPQGDLQFVYRIGGSGNGDWMIADYSGSTHLWSNTRMFISRTGTFTDEYNTSTSRCAYPNHYQYDPNGRMHVTWCWREGTQGANHDIMYSFSDDRGFTWYNDKESVLKISVGQETRQTLLRLKGGANESRIIGDANSDSGTKKTINLDSPGVIVVNLPRRDSFINTQAQAVDPAGRIHVVGWHCTDESKAWAAQQGYPGDYRWGHPYARRYHHYWRDDNGSWKHHEMDWIAGNRPKMYIAANGDAFIIYNASRNPAGMTNDLVQFADGDLIIAAATSQSKWTDWKVVHNEPGLFVNEMLADPIRFKQDQILSIVVQQSPSPQGQSTPLRILEYSLGQ